MQENLVLYSPTRPAINQSRTGLSVYPSVAGRECGGSRITVIAVLGKKYFAPPQMKRVQRANGSLAQVWGRAAPNVLPAESIAKPIGSRKSVLTPRRRLRSPRSFVLRRDRPEETHKPKVNLNIPITARHSRTHYGDPDPRGIETQHIASRLFFPEKGKKTGVNQTQNAAIETQRQPQQKRTVNRTPTKQNRAAALNPRTRRRDVHI